MSERIDEKAQVEQERVRQAVSNLQRDYRDAHLLVKRGRIYDTCSCGWYGSDQQAHAAERISPPGSTTERGAGGVQPVVPPDRPS